MARSLHYNEKQRFELCKKRWLFRDERIQIETDPLMAQQLALKAASEWFTVRVDLFLLEQNGPKLLFSVF